MIYLQFDIRVHDQGKINKINKKLYMGEVSANAYHEVLSKYPLEVGPKFALSGIKPSQREYNQLKHESQEPYNKNNPGTWRTEERHNYSCSKTREEFLLCMFMKETLYNVVTMS